MTEPRGLKKWAGLIAPDMRRKALALLTEAERRNALQVIVATMLAAVSSSAMVLSVMPFLMVISDPTTVERSSGLAFAHRLLGEPSSYDFLVILGIFTVVVVIVACALQIWRTLVVVRFTQLQVHSIGRRLLASYLNRPYEFFLDRNTSDLSANLLSEAEEVVRQFYRPFIEFCAALLTTVAVFAALAWTNAPVAILCAVVIGGAYGGSYLLIWRRMQRVGRARASANQDRFQFANESLRGFRDIRILGREENYIRRYDGPSLKMQETLILLNVLATMPRYIIQAITFCAVVVLCLALVPVGELDGASGLTEMLPMLGVFAFAGQRLVPELQRLYSALATLQFGRAAVDRVYEDLSGAPEIVRAAPSERIRLTESLRFDAVSYVYPTADEASLSDVSIEIRASEKIGIAGSSGAGKTTLGDIVLGLLTPSAGQLRVDGVSIDASNASAWQYSVGFVPQDIFLSDASVAENIALGLTPEEIDRGLMETCARTANIHQFITSLPEGYATRVGDSGVRLSGGQRQRIAIARALYKSADLIVFDEATSALDTLTESEVMAALNGLPGDKTILIIAHRLSTLDMCDRILVLEQGRVAGFGRFDELKATCPEFRRLLAAADAAPPEV